MGCNVFFIFPSVLIVVIISELLFKVLIGCGGDLRLDKILSVVIVAFRVNVCI
tara:strand:+ start:1702 stop:1860 length:159 start_codon:yes stop_codon:yes gene_type:complete